MQNRLREQLRRRESTLGMWVTMESPTVTEIAAALGLDWICIDMEHGHQDFREVMEHLRAARGTLLTPLVRVPDFRQDLVKRALDMGAGGVLLPLVRSAADAELGFQHARYPPRGRRGVGGERAVKWGLEFEEYLTTADAETLVIPIIETREAAEDIDAILATPGLEAIFFGPADLSASHGYLGQWEGPGIAEKILDIRRRAEERGIAAGLMARNADDAAARRAQGFNLIGLGADTGLLIQGVSAVVRRVRETSD
jgi:2-keto-3-deoxy-L-rhamnonate aldolase RhmA